MGYIFDKCVSFSIYIISHTLKMKLWPNLRYIYSYTNNKNKKNKNNNNISLTFELLYIQGIAFWLRNLQTICTYLQRFIYMLFIYYRINI